MRACWPAIVAAACALAPLVATAGEPTVADVLPTHDPFRATFHFCLECRQYTCENCWNPEAGFCQTCYPLGQVPEPAAGNAVAAGFAVAAEAQAAGSATEAPADSAWPTEVTKPRTVGSLPAAPVIATAAAPIASRRAGRPLSSPGAPSSACKRSSEPATASACPQSLARR